jgi:hypothetical protein
MRGTGKTTRFEGKTLIGLVVMLHFYEPLFCLTRTRTALLSV